MEPMTEVEFMTLVVKEETNKFSYYVSDECVASIVERLVEYTDAIVEALDS